MWNFKPKFKFSPLKFLGRFPTRFVVCASRPWPVSSACKNFRGKCPLGPKNIVSRKCRFGWVQTHMPNLQDNGLKFTGLAERGWNRSRSVGFPILDILSRRGDISDQSRKSCKIAQNFACFWPQIFLGEGPRVFGLAL